MGGAQIRLLEKGRWAVSGELSFRTVPALWDRSRDLFDDRRPAKLDLSGVSRTDSAGVALLVEWLRRARRQHKELGFENVPEQMLSIAAVCGIGDLIPLA